jgi:hypothetical protein
MTLDQLIEQVRVERTKAADYMQKLDSALSALTKAAAAPTAAPKAGTGRVWTPEQTALYGTVFGSLFGGCPADSFGRKTATSASH